MISSSFLPDANNQQLRQYERRVNEINKDLVHYEQRVIWFYNDVISVWVIVLLELKVKATIKAGDTLIAGEASADELVKLIHGRTIKRIYLCN